MGFATTAHHNIVQRLKSKLGATTVRSVIEVADKPANRYEVRAKKIVLLFAPKECNSYELVYDYLVNTPGVIDVNGMKFLYYYQGKVYQLKELIPLCDGEVSAPTLRSRLDTMSIDEALQLGCPMPTLSRTRSIKIEYCGNTYLSKDLALLLGVDLKTLIRHLHKKPDLSKPLTFLRRDEKEQYDRNGFVLYKYAEKQYNIFELAKKLAMRPTTLYRLLRVNKMSLEDILSQYPKE